MKKPAIWIYELHQKLKSLLKLGGRSTERSPGETASANGQVSVKKPFLNLPSPWALIAKATIIFTSIVAVYAVLGFYALPAILKTKVPDIIKAQTGRSSSIANIEFNPFTFSTHIQDFKIQEKNGKLFTGFDSLKIKPSFTGSIKELALVVDEITLDKPVLHLIRDNKGRFNFQDMIKPKKKEEEKKPDDGKLFPINLARLDIKNGRLLWDDSALGKPVSEEINPINLSLKNFSTEPKQTAKLDFNLAVKSGGKLAWQGDIGVNPILSEGGIKFDKSQLQKLAKLALPDSLPFQLEGDGLLNIDYKIGMENKKLKITVNKSRFELKGFQFTDQSAGKNTVKAGSFAIETDATATIGENAIEVGIKKAKIDGRDLHFSNQAADPVEVALSALTHETDVKLIQNKDGLKVTTDKALTELNNFQFNGVNQKKVEAKIPKVFLETSYQFGKTSKSMDVKVSHGKFDLHDLELAEPGENTTLIKLPAFNIKEMAVDLTNREVNIDEVYARDADFQAWLDRDGAINYQKLAPTQDGKKVEATRPDYATAKTADVAEDVKTAANVAQTVKPEKDWLVTVKKLAFDNFGFNFEDRSLKKPVTMTAKPIDLKVSNLTNKPEAKLPFQLDVGFNKNGKINIKGDTVIAPLAVKADIGIKNIELDKFQPYVEKFAKLDLLDGGLNVNGKATIQMPLNKPLDVKFKGNAGVADLLTRDQIQNKDLIKWKNLTFKDVNVDLLANRFTASTLLIEKPYARVTIRKDKTMNFSDLAITEKNPPTKNQKTVKPAKTATAKKDQNKAPTFKLAKVKIVDGSSDFADLSLIMPFAAQIKSLDGGAEGITSDKKDIIKVGLKGSAYDLAPVDIQGEISPYKGNYNVSLNFEGLPMPLVTPYMVQFAGYKIEKGKLTLGLHYNIENMNKLEASNNILIDQLELGDRVDNPEAVSLPLGLAITLLKDSEGKIKLDVPLTGSLEDPQFSMGGLIWDALVNVLTKIVSAPFNAIASLAGSDEDLSNVAFKAGSDALEGKEKSKLDGVAKALKEKTALKIDIKGAAFEKEDWPALQDDALFDQLKNRKAAELSKEEGKKVRAEYVELSEDDYNDLLADAFLEKFPALGKKSIFGTPKLTAPDAGDFYKIAKEKMQESIKPEPERLKHLANDRAKAIAKYLVEKGGISHDRVYILDSAIDPQQDGKEIVSALSLKVN